MPQLMSPPGKPGAKKKKPKPKLLFTQQLEKFVGNINRMRARRRAEKEEAIKRGKIKKARARA